MAPPVISWPQKRKASISNASALNKRTRSVSISVKVTHESASKEGPGDPELPVVAKNPQACLSGIPEELLLHVIKYLPPNRTALANLCLADQRCKRVAEEVLYGHVCSWPNYKRAQSVVRNPILASHVRNFHGVFDEQVCPPLVNREPVDPEPEPEPVRQIFNKVLANAHNIRTISLKEDSQRDWSEERDEYTRGLGWLELFNNAVAYPFEGAVNRFSRLKKLTIRSKFLSAEEVSCVFRLPSLVSLSLYGIHQTTSFDDWSVPTSTSPIRELALRNAMMETSAVAQMISSVKSLRSFKYDYNTGAWEPFGGSDTPMSIWPVHSWKLLGDALRMHQDSLEELYTFKYCDSSVVKIVFPDGLNAGTLGSFRDFQKLESCGFSMDAFINHATSEEDLSLYLPPRLTRWYTNITMDDSKLSERCVSALASLRDVVSVGQDRTVRVVLVKRLPLQALKLSRAFTILEKAGIKLELRHDHAMITLNDLRRLEAPVDGHESDGESDGGDEDETDEAEGEEVAVTMVEGDDDIQNGHSATTPANEELEAASQPQNDVE